VEIENGQHKNRRGRVERNQVQNRGRILYRGIFKAIGNMTGDQKNTPKRKKRKEKGKNQQGGKYVNKK